MNTNTPSPLIIISNSIDNMNLTFLLDSGAGPNLIKMKNINDQIQKRNN